MKRRILFLAVAALFAEGPLAQTLPTGGSVTRGAGSIGTAGSAMTVTQTSQRAIFDFTTYNIGAGASVTYAQPGASAVAVSRVPLAAGRSQIDGTLSANGHVMLLNPNGVLFGSGAVVNVGSLTATTGSIHDDSFMAAAASIAIAGATTGSIENRGTITASSSGLVAFVAPSVVNSGVITAVGGRIVLAGAQAATLSFNGGLYEVAVGEGIGGSSVTNSGTLRTAATSSGAVPSGTILLSAPEVESVVSGAINLSGIQRANRIEVHGGVVTLSSDLDAAAVAGTSRAATVSAGAQIQDAVDVVRAGATIDVHGGAYTEGHASVDYFGVAGGGQNFGLHIYKDNLTIRGRKASGAALSGLDDADMPVVTAKYQTGFGAQHFVSGSGVTLDGLKLKPVGSGTNKTLEVIGNDFTLKNSVIDNSGNATAAAFYISDFALPGRPEVESFRLENNRFIAGTSASALVVVASGAGNSTAASNRVFRNNQLIGNPALSGARGFQVQGQMAGIPWQPFTAGAVSVEGNSFSGFDAPVRTVGLMTQPLDWSAILDGNTFSGGAALAFVGDTTTARAGSVAVAAQDGSGGSNDITDTRITRAIQASIDRAQSADTVRALAGTYAESLSVTRALTLKGAGRGSTIIDPAGSNATGILVSGNIGSGAAVTIRDLAVQGGGSGIKVSDAATTLGTLTLDGLAVLDNSSQGFISSNGGSASTAVGEINILNSVFAGNGVGAGSADINLFRFNGDALVRNVDILGTRGSASNLNAATDYGLQIRGQGDIGSTAAAGNVRLENVRITGNYRRAHLGIQRYSDASGIVMSGVSLGGSAGFGRFFSSDQGGALSLGDTAFLASAGEANALDVSIGTQTAGLRVDATGSRFLDENGAQRSDDFAIERRVQHAMDGATLGGVVTWREGKLFVTSDRSIQRGVDVALAGDTLSVQGGSYSENLVIGKSLTIQGAGIGSTTLRSTTTGGDAVTLNSASGVTLADLTIADSLHGLRINGASHDATVQRVAFSGNKYAVRTGTATRADNFRMLDSSISGGVIGVQTYNGYQMVGGVPVATGSFANALFENVTVDGAGYKGFYFETADNLTLRNVSVSNSGNVGDDLHRYGHAVDVNLKYAAFNSITFDNLVVLNSGSSAGDPTRAAVVVKTRGTPGDSATYTAAPASLQQVSMTGGRIEGSNGVGMRFEDLSNGAGGKPSVVVGGGARFRNNGQDIVVGAAGVDATGAAFLDAASGAAVADGFAIEDRVTHALDATGRGLVTWTPGNVYVTQASGSVQRGVDAASLGGTVNVANVNFTEDVVVGQRRNLLFNDSKIGSLTIGCAACGSGIGGTVAASAAAGFAFNAPVVLLKDTVLDTSAAGRPITTAAIDGATAGGQKLTTRSGAGLTSLGNLGAGTRLGAVDVSGATRFTGSTYFASSLLFTGPMTLVNPATAFRTSGGDIVLNGDISGTGGNALTLDAGSGNVTLVSGGAQGSPLGRLEVDANNFTLQGTLWVSGYDIDALGSVALSDHTLRSIGGGTGTIGAVGGVSGGVFSDGPVFIQSASGVDITGSAPSLVIDAPGGRVEGEFGRVDNTGGGLIEVNGRPQVNATLAENANNSRVVPAEITTAASPQASGPQNGGKLRRRKPEDALGVLENGEALEIDLTPG